MLHTNRTANTLAYHKVNNNMMVKDEKKQAVSLKPVPSRQRLRVNITGGGPVGLILASSLIELFQQHIEVTILMNVGSRQVKALARNLLKIEINAASKW